MGFLAGVREHRAEFSHSQLPISDDLTTADILTAADAGDPLALLVLDEAGRALGTMMAILATLLNPSLAIMGGGLWFASQRYLLPIAEREMRRRVLPGSWEPVRIVNSQVTDSAIGAAALVWHALQEQG
jgi:glucokinase